MTMLSNPTKILRSTRLRFFCILVTLLGLLAMMSPGYAVAITTITSQWQSPVGSSGAPTCLDVSNGLPTSELRFGDSDLTNPPCPPTNVQSGFGFTAGSNGTFANGTPFLLGQLTHFNNQVFASSLLTGATLDLSFTSTAPALPALDTQVALDETANNMTTCPYGDTQPCADRVTITPTSIQFVDNGNNYQLEILGLIPGTAPSCVYSQSDLRLSFISDENSNNSSCLFGRVTQLSDAEMQITKSTSATVLAPGDIVDYQIDYTCASTTSTCNGVKIVDFLPSELIYVGSTGSTHTLSSVGTYSSNSNTIEFDFIDPLPAGSTGFVRIRARVRNDGTLINGQQIVNTATSTQTNGPTTTSTTSTPVQTTSNWDVQKTGDPTAYLSTEPSLTDMNYTVQICPNGSNINLLNAQMVDTLPVGATFVTASNGGAYNAGANTVTWTLGDLSASGPCAAQTVVVRFPTATFHNGDTVVNNVTGTGTIPGAGPFTDTASVTRVLTTFVPTPSVTMNKGTPRTDYVVGASVDYSLTPTNTGNTYLYNLVMTDDLPNAVRVTHVQTGISAYPMTLEYKLNGAGSWLTWPGSPFPANTDTPLDVSALPGITAADWVTNIRWNFNSGASTPPGWTLTTPARITGTITSPDRLGIAVATPQTIVNNASLAWQYLPGGVGTCASPNAQCGTQPGSASLTTTVVPNPIFTKSTGGGVNSNQRFLIGQQVGYFDLNVNNNTGIAVDNFTLTDDIPVQFNVTSVDVGSYSGFAGTVGVRYQATNNPGNWVTWPGSPFAQGTSLPVSGLSLPANTYITNLEFTYGTIQKGFSGAPRINGITLATDRNGNAVVDGNSMANTGLMSWTYASVPHSQPSATSNPIHVPTVSPTAAKSTTTSGPYIPTSAVGYHLSFGAAGNSPSNFMNNPVVADLLPTNVNYVGYTYTLAGTLTAPTFEQITNFNGTGRTLLRWTFPGVLDRGQTASIDLSTTLAAGTPSGNLDNTFSVSVTDMPVNGGVTDTQDIDNDGRTDDTIITASTSIPVDQLVGLDSQKRVRGELDSDYSVYPAYGHTVPNGSVDYRLTIINRGNIPVTNVRAVDILPFVGDTGVQDIRPRQSAWRPILTSPVTPLPGVTIYYSTATNPCRPEIVSTGPAGCTAPNWSITPPVNLDTVRSLRFDFAGTMAPGQSFAFNWTMRAPASAADQSIAWNSFAFTSTNATTGVPLRPAEPNKVGIILETTPLTSLIDLKKYTNNADADIAPGPFVPTSSTVTWKYVVTNIGTNRLANITLSDDVEGTVTCPQTALNAGESMNCILTDPTPQLGQYANNATVIGTAVDSSDIPLDGDTNTPGTQLIQPTATDPSHYFGYNSALARLGDYTWIDLNNDGIQDAGEPALGGVTIHLLNSSSTPVDDPNQAGTQDYITTSDTNGFYNFVNLAPGSYIVQFDTPSAYALTSPNTTADAKDSDANVTTGKTGVYTLVAGQYDPTVDAGFIARASLGDRIWIDTNGNGIQDLSETATPAILTGLQVDLMDSTGVNVLATTFTDSSGNYLFNDLLPASYLVRFPAPPTGYLWTTKNSAGSAADNNSDVDVVTHKTVSTTLDAGENDPTWDAGLVAVANIGDYVWADNNFNGIQDGGEPEVPGVTVRLLNSSGTQATDDNGSLISDATTDANGLYHFTNLRPGQYEVQFLTLPAGYIFTQQNAVGNDSQDSDANITTGRTLVTTLDPGETDNSWDAGLIKLASLGDFVWGDTNNNGQQDGGENGVAGAIVTLLNSSGTAVTTDALGNTISPITTIGSGAYIFTNLDPRIGYIVEFTRPASYVFSPANSGNDTTDSDAVPSASLPTGVGRTGTYNLAAGENNTTIDAGLVVPASIGNFVFYDNDNSGTQNGGDAPVTGVTVRLLNSSGNQATDEQGNLIPDLVTPASGLYNFTHLVPGTYALAFSTLPSTYTFAKRDIGADTADSDPNRFTGRTINTTLDPNENDDSWDAGLVVAAALGDYVWEDQNANGQQDEASSLGVNGVTVRLLDGSNNPIDNPNTATIGDAYVVTTVTVAGNPGYYAFTGLPPNETYRVRFDRPTGYLFTLSNTGNDASDSDGLLNGRTNVGNVRTVDITTLTPGSTDNTWDQGVLLPSALGDFVWSDVNNDGLQTGESANGINSVTVNLLDSSGNPVDDPNTSGSQNYTTSTTGGGAYHFTNLYPGSYIVEFGTPSGYKRAQYFVGAGTNAATDSNMQTTGINAGRTPTITLPYNTTDNTWDAGFVPLAALGDFVWRDNNDDGIQNNGETGVAGATVTLLDSTGTPVTTDGMGNAISPVTTDGSGAYHFTNLDPDIDYIVQFTLPTAPAGQAGYKFSPQDVSTGGGTDSNDSDADTTTGKTAIIPLNPGQTDNTWDAGMAPLAQLGDYVWDDTDGDGIQNNGETGHNGVTVNLYKSSNLTTSIATTTTANNPVGGAAGYYQFLNLDAGSYVVEFVLPNGYIFTRQNVTPDTTDSDADRFTGQTGTYTLNWGDSNQTVDAGILQPASLGDYVWYDTNDDGLQTGETGQNGVVVRLLDASNNPVDDPNQAPGTPYVLTTANNPVGGAPGYYLFDGLFPGDYRVHFDLPASTLPQASSDYVISRQNQGGDTIDSDPNRASGITATINLIANEQDITNDAGILLRGAKLGNRVWIDINNNGVQDNGEVGLNGVTVTLLNGAGGTDIDPITAGTQTLSTTTANDSVVGDGWYQFTSLVPGTYIVEFTLPAGYQFSPQNAGSPNDDTVDSDANISTGRTAVITLAQSGDDQTWDAGVVPLASIGDYVWSDQNNDGLQDNGELPISGVTVHLLDTLNNPVDNPNTAAIGDAYTAITDVNGNYKFTNLPPDVSYVVQFDQPAHYRRSTPDVNSNGNDATDSDADLTNGRSAATLLSPNEYDNSVDAGFVPLATLGDYVWGDTDGDGVQDGSETGVNGVTVNLYAAGNLTTPIATTTTTTNGTAGYYQFADLDKGDYVVEFVAPAGYMLTQKDATTDTADSDADHLTGQTSSYAIDWGDSNQTIDAGILQPAALGDFVWHDADDDGVQDSGEAGIPAVTVHLLDSTGNPVNDPNNATPTPYTTSTDGSGAYAFTGLFPGDYQVQFDLPSSDYVFARQDINSGATTPASSDSNDSDADRGSGVTGTYTLSAGQTDNTVDAGMLQRASMGDVVWNDLNGNGIQDGGSEVGVPGVTVTLFTGAGSTDIDPITTGTQTYSVVTDGSGAYHFTNLVPGDYYVVFTLPTGYIFTLQNATTDAADSDAVRLGANQGRTITTTLVSDEDDLTWDAGILQPAALGDVVWHDADDDGVQDSGEAGIPAVTAHLLDGAGNPVNDPNNATLTPYTTSTDGSGAYAFTGLFPGDYQVQFDLPSSDYVFARQDINSGATTPASSDSNDSDADRGSGITGTYTLSAGQTDNSVDAGMLQRASMGDVVWNDLNGNGIQDGGSEIGVPGVTVTLFTGAGSTDIDPITTGTQTYSVVTDGSGAYHFTNLVPGDYYVVFSLPSGYIFTLQDATTDAADSDAVRLGATQGRTITTTLVSDEDDLTWDAGILQPAALGNFVWHDADDDGVQDSGEAGIPSVTVHLLDGSGNPVNDPNNATPTPYTASTDGSGAYAFTGLFPGDYKVQFDLPSSDYVFARQDINSGATTPASSDSNDSDADRGSGITGTYTLSAGQTDNSVDAGMLQRASMGDVVWNDLNGNGIQDGGSEVGVPGVTVTLFTGTGSSDIDPITSGTQTYSVVTDGSGAYHFINLVPGDYYVVFTLPAGYIFTLQDATTDAADSDAVRLGATQGRTITTTLVSDEDDLTWDAGILQPAALGNFVWHDADDDGVQDGGEAGIPSVTVHLLDSTGNPVNDPNNATPTPYTTSTDGSGAYAFTGLFPGDYQVQFDLPSSDYVFARQDQGADAADSDVDRSSGVTGTYTLSAGQTDNTVDAGMMERASIGDFVWRDINDNGVQDSGEVGVQGVTVHLTDENGTVINTITGVNGDYLFDNLVPGTYSLQFVLPSNQYEFSDQNQGGNSAKDSDADFTTGVTITTHLLANEDDLTWDAGIVPLASIGDRVWIDINNDGIQDNGEANYQGATVNLLNSSGDVIDTTTTGVNGDYLFDLLTPSQYAIEVVLPFNYQFSPQDQGVNDAKDSDVNFGTGRTVVTTLDPDEHDMTWDAGIVPLVSIGDTVWVDMNNDGVQNNGEIGAPGVTVNLLDSSGTQIDTQQTDGSGNYKFEQLPPGDYRIEFVLPAHNQFSPEDQGGNDTLDSDANISTGRTILVNLPPGTDDMSRDAGLVPLVSIGDRVWRDNNGDGVQDAGEPGIEGITVHLLGSPNGVLSTTTDANGNYVFEDLPPGDYAIEVVVPPQYTISPENTGADTGIDSDVNPTTGRSVTTTLIPDEDDMTWDAGLAPLANLGDRVWIDNNGNGVQDAGELGKSGVTVRLLDAGGNFLRQTTTDDSGNYLFENLLPGGYIVEVIRPGGYNFSPLDASSDDAADSDVSLTSGRTIITTLEYGENDYTWDAGIVPLGKLGDYVWNDLNANGVQDAGEPGIPNVKVTLTYPNGTIISVRTDGSGKYLFVDLPAGFYTIQVDPTTLPAGYGQTYDLNGPLDHSAGYTLSIGETVLTVDFGYVELGSIGDTIWLDSNHNGLMDGKEHGIPGIGVTLVLPDGTTRTTVTDSNGHYIFEDLFPGHYRVVIDVSTLPPGVHITYDPDGQLDSWTEVDLSAGEAHLTADFGYAPAIGPTAAPTTPSVWQPVPACLRSCVDWDLYTTNQTGDWEIFRLGNLSDRPSINPNLSQGKGADDVAPTRSPNAEWIVFSSNRDGNWELYAAPTDGDSTKIRRLTYNTVAKDTDPVWGPNNYVAYETTRDGNWELYLLDMTTGVERRLTNNAASDINAYWSTDGTKLVFQSDRSSLWQVYQLDLATNAVTLLSDGTANDVDPQYSSDSSHIAFRSYRDGDKSTLYLMDADGSNLKRISAVGGDATNHSWSTDDSLIAYQSDLDGDLDIYVYQVSTGTTRKLTNNDIPDYAPTWKCNSTTVIFTSDASGNPDIYDADALPIAAPAIDVKQDAQQLTTEPSADIYPENAPVEENASREGRLPGATLGDQTDFLRPDASITTADPSLDSGKAWEAINSCPIVCPAWLLYNSNRTGDPEIFRTGVDGSSDINLSLGVGANDRRPTRSPNAQWIAFTSDRDGNEELYIAAADGSHQQRLTNNGATDTDPAWSPDSQRIVFESNRSGNWDLYMFDVQTGVETQITSSTADDTNANWSSAGGTVVFESTRDGRSQLYVYDLATKATTRLIDIPQDAHDPVYSNGGGQVAFRVQEADGHSVLYVVRQDGSGLQALSDRNANASNPAWQFDDTLLAYQSDLDGDLDIYVYDFATKTTRQLTDNKIADYAPTWVCGEPTVAFTSEVTGNDDIFEADALPITTPAIDVATQAQQITSNPATDRFPLGAPNEEYGSRADQ